VAVYRTRHRNELRSAYKALETSIMDDPNTGDSQSLHVIGVYITCADIIKKNRKHYIKLSLIL